MKKRELLLVLISFIGFPTFLYAQYDFGYNLLPEKNISAVKPAQKPQQLDRATYWKPLPSHPADLVSKQGYYPKDIERYYYFQHYLGLQLYDPKKKNNRSFATIKLKHALEKGKKYKIYLGGFFPYNSNFIESHLREVLRLRTEQDFNYNQRMYRIYKSRFEKIPLGFALSKSAPNSLEEIKPNGRTEIIAGQGFFKYEFEFEANEEAEFLTIGNFLNDKELPQETLFDVEKYILVFESSITQSKVENLVPNGSFEEYTDAPTNLGQWWRLKDWFSPHPNREHNADLPSPDLMHTVLARAGAKPPLRGNGSGRVGYINFDTLNFNEGLAVKLKKPLKKGKKYAISFNVGSTNKTRNNFVYRSPTQTDLDSLKVQFGFRKTPFTQGRGTFLEADQLFQYSQYLSFLFRNKQELLTFEAQDDYEYFAFGYFEELDVPQNGQVGVVMDDIFIYEVPDEELALVTPTLVAINTNPDLETFKSDVLEKEEQLPDLNNDTPKPVVKKATEKFYDQRDSTNVRVKFSLDAKKPLCKLVVYDHGTEDGDIVTLKLNDQILAEHLKIRRRPNVENFDISLKKGENFIYPIAENMGRIPPNTIQVVLDCEGIQNSYRLFSRPGSSEALRIVLPE